MSLVKPLSRIAGVVALLTVGIAGAQTKTKVTVFEAWYIHSESVGTPTAIDKGLFGDLDVTVAGGGPRLSPIERTVAAAKNGGIAFGVDNPYNVLEAREKRSLPLVVVAHDFQTSALRLISWTKIQSARDLHGPIATWADYDKQVKAAVGADWKKRISVIDQRGDPGTIGTWLRKEYPSAHAMTYNELLIAKQHAKDPFFTYAYKEFGIDWPENAVFTTEEIVRRYPRIVQAFLTGRYRGYVHAFANRADAVRTLVKYNRDLEGYEAHEMEGLDAIRSLMVTVRMERDLGFVDIAAWDRLGRDLTKAGFYGTAPNVKAAYTTAFPSGVRP